MARTKADLEAEVEELRANLELAYDVIGEALGIEDDDDESDDDEEEDEEDEDEEPAPRGRR